MLLNCSLATLVPHSKYFHDVPIALTRDEVFKVSSFAYIRFDQEELILSSPRGYAHLTLARAEALLMYHRFCSGISLAGLSEEFKNKFSPEEIEKFIALLLACQIVERVLPESPGLIGEEASASLRQWEFHDLLLQSQSRMGRGMSPIGGTHRFHGEIPPPPAIEQRNWGGKVISLTAPSADDGYGDITLEDAIEKRKTIRKQGPDPITLDEVGGFLYRTARVLSRQTTPWPREYPFGGEYTKRPYPNGGARYELELYVTANSCKGLDRGFYYYDPLAHRMILVSEPNEEMEQLLSDSLRASTCETQILITIASRFQRCSWKYEGLAMSLQLKNVGVLYSQMYLIATAMGLAPCALGAGDSDLFSRLSGLDYFEESSIGEFMLGSRPSDEPS